MMNIPGMVRRAFTTSSNSAPPESVKNVDSLTDSSRDSVEASNMSTPALLDSNVVSTAPSEPEGPKEVELSHEIIAKTIEEAILSTPSAMVRTPNGKSTRSPRSPSSEPRRSVRERKVVATYNASILSGNAVHTRRAFRTNQEYSLAQVSRNTAAITMVNGSGEWIDYDGTPITESMATPAKSPKDNSVKQESASKDGQVRKSGRLEHRPRTSYAEVTARVAKKVKEDVNEFSRSLRPRKRAASEEPATEEPAPTKKLRAASAEPAESIKVKKPPTPEKKRVKQWFAMGLYAGQKRLEQRRKSGSAPSGPERKHLPMPMFTGHLLLEKGRNFVLPFEILNPLTKNEAPAWTNLRKNRFVGDALPTWKKKDHSTQSTCNCTLETKCDSNCLNRSMRYECNEDNCRVGPAVCQNRSFQELKWRSRNKNLSRDPEKNDANMWGVGIEVFRTANRGHGVRAMRSFEPSQAICEYTGEIITQDEADHRMNEEYKGKTDYYLMTFHEGLIIDATKGSICRFVNHSCDPNCHVEKWVVNGEPRMALFANEDGIKVGEELTYDYNFAPYSQKNLQVCLCGAEGCRGVLGPRNLADQKTQKVVTTTKTVIKKKMGANSRTPSLSPKKKPFKNGSPLKGNQARRQSAPAVAPVSKALLATQQKSRAERALNRSSTGKPRRKRMSAPAITSVRRKSVKTTTSVSARGKQIRRTVSSKVVKTVKPKAAGAKKASGKTKRDHDDPFRFPESPPPSPLRSGRQAKPSPKALENSIVSKSVQVKKKSSSGLLRASLSAKVSKKRIVSSPLASVSTPTSRVGKRVITPSPKVRDNADTNSVLSKSKSIPDMRLVSDLNGPKVQVSLEGPFARKIQEAKSREISLNDKEIRRPLANKKNA